MLHHHPGFRPDFHQGYHQVTMMKRYLIPAFSLLVLFSACEKPTPEPPEPPVPAAPTSSSLSQASFNVAQAGESLSLTITAPARPKLTLPDWISYKDGTYQDYKITVGLNVAANDTYESRSATVTVTATGASDVSFTVTQQGKEKPVYPTPTDNNAWKMAAKMGMGWNIGNQLEAHNNGDPSETAWTGTLCTQATFDKVKAAGFSSVRIPVTWINLIGEAPEYKLDATRLARLKEVVGFAHNAGLVTIVNIHHDGAESQYWLSVKPGADNDAILAKIAAVWTQLAQAFREDGDWLILESFNEINDGGWGWSAEYQTADGKKRQNDILNGWNQKFVDVVRATGGENATRWLGVPGYAADVSMTLHDGFVLPNDPAGKTMVAVHTYGPYEFGQTCAVNQWGHNRNVRLSDPSFGEEYYKDQMNELYNKWISKGIPVYFGEYGCANRSDDKGFAFQLYFLEYMTKCFHTFGMSGFIWDNGAKGNGNEIYGIIDHGTGEYMDPVRGPKIVSVIKKGLTDTSSSYTLDTVYDTAPRP